MTSILTSNQENIQSVRGELLSDSPHFATCLAEEGGRWEVDTGHQTDQYPPPSTLHHWPQSASDCGQTYLDCFSRTQTDSQHLLSITFDEFRKSIALCGINIQII